MHDTSIDIVDMQNAGTMRIATTSSFEFVFWVGRLRVEAPFLFYFDVVPLQAAVT